MTHNVAIRLKIPDNEAYTALTTLRGLGVALSRLERADIWQLDDGGDSGDLAQRVERNETLFNQNKHELEVLHSEGPREGEVWIEQLRAKNVSVRIAGVREGRRFVAWRLFDPSGEPADVQTVRAAVEQLLCNPAIERSIMQGKSAQ